MQSMVAMQQHVATKVNPVEGSTEWESALSANAAASFFHGAVWARILTGTYGFVPYYLKAGENPVGLLPVMEADSFISGRRGIALPFTDECDPIAADPDLFNTLFRAAVGHLSARNWKYLEIRGGESGLSTDRTAAEFLGHEIKLEG